MPAATTIPLSLVVAMSGALMIGQQAWGAGAEQLPRSPLMEHAVRVAGGQPPAPDLGNLARVVSGNVTVTPSARAYARAQVIRATITNGMKRSIYSEDMQTDCSIVIMERWDGRRWQRIQGCNMERKPLTVAIGAGRGRTVAITPLSTHFDVAPGSSKPAFGAGTYRITFVYRLDPDPAATPHVTRSPSFTVRP